jgi:hypothetical protein
MSWAAAGVSAVGCHFEGFSRSPAASSMVAVPNACVCVVQHDVSVGNSKSNSVLRLATGTVEISSDYC